MGADQAIRHRGQCTRRGLSIPAMMVLVAVVALFMTWYARAFRDAERQRQAVKAIEADGGFVFYDWEYRNGKHTGIVKPPSQMAGTPLWHRFFRQRR
jgi:hypothetical protein